MFLTALEEGLTNMEIQEALVPTGIQGGECAAHTVFISRVLWALLCGYSRDLFSSAFKRLFQLVVAFPRCLNIALWHTIQRPGWQGKSLGCCVMLWNISIRSEQRPKENYIFKNVFVFFWEAWGRVWVLCKVNSLASNSLHSFTVEPKTNSKFWKSLPLFCRGSFATVVTWFQTVFRGWIVNTLIYLFLPKETINLRNVTFLSV